MKAQKGRVTQAAAPDHSDAAGQDPELEPGPVPKPALASQSPLSAAAAPRGLPLGHRRRRARPYFTTTSSRSLQRRRGLNSGPYGHEQNASPRPGGVGEEVAPWQSNSGDNSVAE